MGAALVKEIAVLLAAYRGEGYLPQQLQSLAAQDDPAFTVLMRDDGDPGATLALLEAAAKQDARFHLAKDQNTHLGAIRNFWDLLAAADAPYIAFCDQDDVWHANRLSRCRAAMEQAETQYGADVPLLVHSDSRLVNADGQLLHESFFAHQGWRGDWNGLAPLLVQNHVTGCTLLMNAALRRLALQHGDPDTMVMHDWFLAQTAAAFGHVVFIPEALIDYRQHAANVKGASRRGLLARGVRALGAAQQGRERIRMTYRQAARLLAAYGEELPDASRRLIEAYLATEAMPKLRRIHTVRRLGCVMQSRTTRLGQMLFG